MKIIGSIFVAVALSSISQAAVTLQFGGGAGFLTNLQNSGGQNNQNLVWGILVDTTGNGFQLGSYVSGALITDNAAGGLPNGQFLSTTGGATDDLLVISQLLMTTGGTGDNSTGLAKPTNLASLNFANGLSQGDSFGIVWFDYTQKNDGSFQVGDAYGFYTRDEFVIPADSGSAVSFAALFAGDDPARLPGFTFIPEPSSLTLGAFGLLAIFRRKR